MLEATALEDVLECTGFTGKEVVIVFVWLPKVTVNVFVA